MFCLVIGLFVPAAERGALLPVEVVGTNFLKIRLPTLLPRAILAMLFKVSIGADGESSLCKFEDGIVRATTGSGGLDFEVCKVCDGAK